MSKTESEIRPVIQVQGLNLFIKIWSFTTGLRKCMITSTEADNRLKGVLLIQLAEQENNFMFHCSSFERKQYSVNTYWKALLLFIIFYFYLFFYLQ